MQIDRNILVLTDNITGHSHQAVALAKSLEGKFSVENLKYNILANLPSLLLGHYPIHAKQANLVEISAKNINPPDIIISAGRRTALVSLYLKRKAKNSPKVIQIMNPVFKPHLFDIIILPQHDKFNYDSSNVIRIIGALTDIEKISAEEIIKNYPQVQNSIAVIVGGAAKGYNFTISDAQLLVSILANILRNHSSHLFITFSRRTPEEVKQIFYLNFPAPHVIYDPSNSLEPNPYLAMLSGASYIITTADSISMCSEAASTAKPLYVFYPNSFKLKKHRFFIQQLFDLGVAKKLDLSVNFLELYSYEALNETKRVAKIIESRLQAM